MPDEMPFGEEWWDAAGPPKAPPVVLLHGVWLSRKMWAPHLEELAETYRVLAPDLPAHGALRDFVFGLETAAGVVADLIAREAGGRALVVGHSLGGYTAMELARRHPERVSGLVLADCTANLRGLLGVPCRLAGALARALPRAALDAIAAAFFRCTVLRPCAEALIREGFADQAIPDAVSAVVGVDFLPRVRAFPERVLFLNGEGDWIFRRHERAFLRTARDSRLQLLPRAGHLCPLQQPGAFSAAVREFARSLGW